MISEPQVTTVTANGSPPAAAATLYTGEVMHARLSPFVHRFTYRVFSLLLDLDRLAEAGRQSPLFSVNSANIVSFHEADHVERQGETARAHAMRLLAEAGVADRVARILLLAYPRVFGYVFNPISVYFAYDGAGGLLALIYSVRNTFGQRHIYVARIEDGEFTDAGVRQSRRKLFHVSPFIGMGARYDFRVLPPGRIVRLRIHETESGTPLLSATFGGRGKRLETGSLATCLLKIPFVTWKITAGIHWEALKLWLKGARFRSSPAAPPLVSLHEETPGPAE